MSADFTIIDCHLHTGVQHVNWGWESIRPLLLAAGIRGAAPIPPVEDIYDRYDPEFTDPPAWHACRRAEQDYQPQPSRGPNPGHPRGQLPSVVPVRINGTGQDSSGTLLPQGFLSSDPQLDSFFKLLWQVV
jgi:hypothetical protein